MKVSAVLLSGFLGMTVCAARGAELSRVQSVYLLPMTNGLDQYLANRLTNLGVFHVVADPKKADAVFTDRLGEAFENRLEELYPAAPPDKPQAETKKPAEGKEAKEGKGGDAQEGDTDEQKPEQPPIVRFNSFSRAKGTIFLVDPRTRDVLWSVYERPKNTSPEELDRTAGKIAGRIERALKPQK